MKRALASLAIVGTIALLTGCTRYFREVSRISRRVEVVAFYRCQDPGCKTMDPAHSRIEIHVDGRRRWMIKEGAEGVENIYLACGRIFVRLATYNPTSTQHLGVLCENGKLAEVLDLTDLVVTRDALIKKLSCRPESPRSFEVDLYYYRTVDAGKVDSTVRRLTRHVNNLPCTPLVIEPDGPPSTALSPVPRK